MRRKPMRGVFRFPIERYAAQHLPSLDVSITSVIA
jgi:hypothetical protein